jgi:hypothetical protein
MRKPRSGRKTIKWYIIVRPSALHHVDVFDRDRAAVAEEDDEYEASPIAASAAATVSTNRAKTWPTHIAERCRKGDEIDVDRKQDQLAPT